MTMSMEVAEGVLGRAHHSHQRISRWRSGTRCALAATLALALAATACSHTATSGQHASDAPSSAHVALSGSTPATLSLSGGVTLSVPAGAVAGVGELTGHVEALPAPAPRGLVAPAHGYDFEITGTHQTGNAALRFPEVQPVSDKSGTRLPPPVLAFFDRSTRSWTAVPSAYDARSGTVTATSAHLSFWSVFTLDVHSVLGMARDFLAGVIGTTPQAEQPRSSGQDQLAPSGVSINSSSGSLVKWSAGVISGQTQLKVVDNRGYALALTYPDSWTYTWIGGGADIENLVIDRVSAFLTTSPRGLRTVIIPSGKGVQFSIPQGAGGSVAAEPSVEAYLLSGLLYGIDTLEMVYSDLPWTKSDPSKTRKAVEAMFASSECVRSMTKMMANPVASAHDAGEVFRTAAELATGCLGDEWKVAYGLAGAVRSFVAGVLLWLVDGIKLVFAGIGAALDTGIYFNGYQISVIWQTPSGRWTGSDLTITDHSLGAVTQGMTLAQAEAAAGVNLESEGDGVYHPTNQVTGATHLLITGETCFDASRTGPGPGTVVSTPAGVSLGEPMSRVFSVYGRQAQNFMADPAWSGPGNVPAGIMVQFTGGVLLFVGSSSDGGGGDITSIRGAVDSRAASSLFC